MDLRARREQEDQTWKFWERINEKPCSQLLPSWLYISGEQNAKSMSATEQRYGFGQFTHVVSMRGKVHTSPYPSSVAALPIAVGDAMRQDLKQHFERIYQWIEQAREYPDCRLLVHCKHGV